MTSKRLTLSDTQLCGIMMRRCQNEWADEYNVNIGGISTNILIVLVCPFLPAPAHHDAAELGVGEGETFARHQAVVIYMRKELDAMVQLTKVDQEGAYFATAPHLDVIQEVSLHSFACVF